MTGQLTATMQSRADDLAPLDLDLDAIVRDGDRRARHRRLSLAGAGVVGAVAASVVLATVIDGRGDQRDRAVAAPGSGAFSYAVGSVIHTGGATTDVGFPVDAYVPTKDGDVVTDVRQQVYAVDSSGVHRIGRLTDRHTPLKVDDAGTVVAWVDGDRLEVYRVADQTVSSVPVQPLEGSASLNAVTSRTVWLYDERGTVTYDLSSGNVRTLTGYGNHDQVRDAAADRLLLQVAAGDQPMGVSIVDAPPSGGAATWHAQPQVTSATSGDLSPDGRHWFTQDEDQFAVFDSATGERQDPSHPGFAFAAPYQWIDDDTMAVLALRRAEATPQDISLLTCHVSTDSCVVTAADIGTDADVAVPVGQSLRAQ